MKIKSATFITSARGLADCPVWDRPEFAFIGRSNVGKSSLINLLANQHSLAKVSATPGKTRLLNFFLMNDSWSLVDLPGYGFAKAAKAEKFDFNQMAGDYLEQRENLRRVFVLIDSRHPPQRIDVDFTTWLGGSGVPFSLIFTKADKQSAVQNPGEHRPLPGNHRAAHRHRAGRPHELHEIRRRPRCDPARDRPLAGIPLTGPVSPRLQSAGSAARLRAMFTPKWKKEAQHLAKGARKFVHYKRDLLKPDRVAEIESRRTDLLAAIKSGDRAKVDEASKQVRAVCENSLPQEKPVGWLEENVEVMFVAIVIALGLRAYYLQPFRIPTGSMQPTLNGIIGKPLPEAEWPAFPATHAGKSPARQNLREGRQ